jgi:hypothetical protein
VLILLTKSKSTDDRRVMIIIQNEYYQVSPFFVEENSLNNRNPYTTITTWEILFRVKLDACKIREILAIIPIL